MRRPDGLWTRIEGALAEEPPRLVLPRPARPCAAEDARPGASRVVGIAAAFAVVVASITVTAVLHGEMDDQQSRLDRLSASVARDGVTRAAKRRRDGSVVARARCSCRRTDVTGPR